MPVQAIGYGAQFVKLVFVAVRPRLPVIANQRAGFSGNPPVREEMYRQLLYRTGKHCVFLVVIVTWFYSTGGLPHNLSGLVRNDR